MGKRGGTRHLKRISAPKVISLERKAKTFVQRPMPGPHKGLVCVPLSHVVKSINLANTMKEVKKILASRYVLVDGKVVTNPKFPIGFMDAITVGDKSWRVLFDRKGVLKPVETKDARMKICRIEKKFRIKNGRIQLSLHDGRTLIGEKGNVGDCILISLPEGKVMKLFPLEPKMNCLIIGGKHVAKKAVIEEIIPGTATRMAEVRCDIDGIISTTSREYIFPIGDFKI
ncbi:MAG: S4 domain-containing protein [Candidatus Micrarchaeia archaeon]